MQEGVVQVRIANIHRWRWDETDHLVEWHQSSGAIVKEDGVSLQRVGFRRRFWEGTIHYRPRKELIRGWIDPFNPCPGRILLLKGWIIVS